MSFKKIAYTVLFLIILITPHMATAAILDVDDTGQLIGASGVNVNGSSYNVTFASGTCASLFMGCDDALDFVFDTEDQARAAGQALFDQVFLDESLGTFDLDPNLTNGCMSSAFCGALITYGVPTIPSFRAIIARNLNDRNVVDADALFTTALGPSVFNNINISTSTFANFSLEESSAVPIPGALWMMLTGLTGIGATCRKKKIIAKEYLQSNIF